MEDFTFTLNNCVYHNNLCPLHGKITHIPDLHSHVQYYGSTFLTPSYFLQPLFQHSLLFLHYTQDGGNKFFFLNATN